MASDGESSILTPGFKALLDLFTSAVAVGIAYGIIVRGFTSEFLLVDIAFSIVMFLSGIISRVPHALSLTSSLPVGGVNYAVTAIIGSSSIPLWVPVIIVGGLRAGRLAYDTWFIASGMGRLGRILDTIIIQAGILASVTILGGSMILYLAEVGAPGSRVHSFLDALWLTLATITTVGYGDLVPVTGLGKAIAGMIMLVGIGLFTFFLSSLAAGLVKIVMAEEPVSPLERKKRLIAEMIKHIEDLTDEEFEQLRRNLDLLYTIATADRRGLLKIDLEPESLGINPNLLREALGEEAT